MLHVEGLNRPGLSDIALDVADGGCVAVVGRSGSGKSLLLRAIADLDDNTGTVSLDGKDRNDFDPCAWRRQVMYVPAESGWWRDHVGEHFDEPDIAAGYLVRMGFQGDVMSWPVSRLSTGERQRLALLRAMVTGPRVLLLDEPTSALDPEATAKIESVLHEKLRAGVAIVLVTHDARQAARMSDVRRIMDSGTMRPMDGETS